MCISKIDSENLKTLDQLKKALIEAKIDSNWPLTNDKLLMQLFSDIKEFGQVLKFYSEKKPILSQRFVRVNCLNSSGINQMHLEKVTRYSFNEMTIKRSPFSRPVDYKVSIDAVARNILQDIGFLITKVQLKSKETIIVNAQEQIYPGITQINRFNDLFYEISFEAENEKSNSITYEWRRVPSYFKLPSTSLESKQ